MHPDDLMPRLSYAGLVPAALLEPPAVEVLPGAVSRLQLPYRTLQGWRPLQLDLHLPAAATGPVPVVVYVHGGSFLAGRPTMGPWRSLPASGVAVASIAYRLAGEAAFPEPVEDVRAALAWLATDGARYGVDPTRIALWGSSAGGYLALLAAMTGCRALGRPIDDPGAVPDLAAVVAHYPVTDPTRLREDADGGDEQQVATVEAAMAAFFTGATDVPTALVDHLDDTEHLPPVLLQHGDDDHRVALAQSQRLARALEERGRAVGLRVVPGADHGDPVFESTELVGEVLAFLSDHGVA